MNKDQVIAIAVLTVLVLFGYFFFQKTKSEDYPGENKTRLAHSMLEDGDLDAALKTFDEALAIKPDNADAFRGKGITLMMMKRFDESKAMFDRSIELEPESALNYANRGTLNDRTGQYEDAVSDYRKAIKLEPKLAKGPGWLWRFLHNAADKPPTLVDRIRYIESELQKPEEERLLRIPELDERQKMYKK